MEYQISDDDSLLSILRKERYAAIGMDNDDDLNIVREQALNYYKGVMPDMPRPSQNRSGVVSTKIADAVETIMPDLMEVFVGGEDGLTFRPHGEEDVEAAEQETDYLRHVVYQQNDGFKHLYDAFKEALLLRTGLLKWWWNPDAEYDDFEQVFQDPAEMEMWAQKNSIEVQSAEQTPEGFKVTCLLYTSPSPRDQRGSRMPSSA